MNKIYLLPVLLFVCILSYTNPAFATNHPTSIFSYSLSSGHSNTYSDAMHNFSITPPVDWNPVRNIPDKISNNTIAVFSNNDKNHLATLVIFYRPISQNITDAINKYSDKDIIYSVSQELSGNGQDSKTSVLKGAIDRYTDGVRVATITETNYTSDNSTSISENIMYFLNNGNQYTLILTSNPNDFNKNSVLFENSANSFLVNQTSTKNQQLMIPSWIKNNAKLWSESSINDGDFIKGIQYLISSGIMKIPQTQYGPHQSSGIPVWIKNDARFWSEGQISDDEFVKGIQYLVSSEIIKV